MITAVALGVTAHFVPGIVVTSTAALVFGALILGLVNAIVRPVLVVLTLPITEFRAFGSRMSEVQILSPRPS
jgi:putative membrane protein